MFFNASLQERRESWRLLRKSVSLYDQMKSLTEIRAADAEIAAMSVHVQRSALKRVDEAFKAFFRRVKNGETPGHPRFKAFGRYRSFSFPMGKRSITGEGRSARLHIPNFGEVRMNMYRPLKGEPLEVTIRRDSSGRWWAAISCDLGAAPSTPEPSTITANDVLGADMGISSLVAFSDGVILENPRHFELSAAKLARRQREHARKRKGSKSKERARKLVAKTHQHIANQRTDLFRKSACNTIARCKVVVFEDLNIVGLTRGMLGKHVNLAAWNRYRQITTCKAEEAGKLVLLVDPRYTSQLCSGCGELVPKELDERWHHCPHCGVSLDRDVNAARVIKARGITALGTSVGAGQPEKVKPVRRPKKTPKLGDQL